MRFSGNIDLLDKADVPILEGKVAKTWGKEDELRQLKSDLAALDRKIAAELAPKHDEKDGEEVKREDKPQTAQTVEAPSTDEKKSMVAEPNIEYSTFYRASAMETKNHIINMNGTSTSLRAKF